MLELRRSLSHVIRSALPMYIKYRGPCSVQHLNLPKVQQSVQVCIKIEADPVTENPLQVAASGVGG